MIKSQKTIFIVDQLFTVTEFEPDDPITEIPIIARIPGETEYWLDEDGNVVLWIKHETIVLGEERPLNPEPIAENN